MATIKFFIQSENNPAGIYLRLREGVAKSKRFPNGTGIDAKAKTKFVINPNDWSPKGQPKNLKDENFKKLHKNLVDLGTDLLAHYNNSVGKLTIDSQWLKDFINPPEQVGTIPNKLLAYFEYYALHKKNSIQPSTIKKNRAFQHLVERFQEATKTEYFIKDVNANFKLSFEEYCNNKKYDSNTVAYALKFIKTICRHARKNGVETHFQLDDIFVKIKKSEIVVLTIEELEKIQSKKLEHEYLINARDWLIISCETGQRVYDLLRFNKEMIRYQKNKKNVLKPFIDFTQDKTGKKMSIPLTTKVMEILKKRKGEFPRQISDQRYNEYIKEVCKKAEIDQIIKGSKAITEKGITRKVSGLFPKYELITSHIGRRSLATNNYGQVPTSILTYMTGHSTETIFLKYIGKTATEKAMQAAEYFK